MINRDLAFWTMTLWQDRNAMLAYRNTGSHRVAMGKLFFWCDEAAVISLETSDLISWKEGRNHLLNGRFTAVKYPSSEQIRREIAELPDPPSPIQCTFGPL